MDGFLITADGAEREISPGRVRHLLDTSARFWLDLAGVDRETADGLLRDTFASHWIPLDAPDRLSALLLDCLHGPAPTG